MSFGIDDVAGAIISGTTSELTKLLLRKTGINIHQVFGPSRTIYLSYAEANCPYGKALCELFLNLQFGRHFKCTHGPHHDTGSSPSQCIETVMDENKVFMIYLLSGVYRSSLGYGEMAKTEKFIRTSRDYVVLCVPEFDFDRDACNDIKAPIGTGKKWISLDSSSPSSKQECRNRVFRMATGLGHFLNLKVDINTLLNSLDTFMETICQSQQAKHYLCTNCQSRMAPQPAQGLPDSTLRKGMANDGADK